MNPHIRKGRFYIMRHGETVFNATRRLQSNSMHTPLTVQGFAQAQAMAQALQPELHGKPAPTLHVSDTGRTLQTAAVLAETLGLDWFSARRTPDLREIDMGSWCGRSYSDVEDEAGPIVIEDHLLRPAPDGEDYPMIATRLRRWIAGLDDSGGDHIVVMHGISSRVLRGIMANYPVHPLHGAPIAPSLRQGSIALVSDGAERVLFGAQRGVEHA